MHARQTETGRENGNAPMRNLARHFVHHCASQFLESTKEKKGRKRKGSHQEIETDRDRENGNELRAWGLRVATLIATAMTLGKPIYAGKQKKKRRGGKKRREETERTNERKKERENGGKTDINSQRQRREMDCANESFPARLPVSLPGPLSPAGLHTSRRT